MKLSNSFYNNIKKDTTIQQVNNCTRCFACKGDAPAQEKCALKSKYKGNEACVTGLALSIQDVLSDKIQISSDLVDLLFRCTTCNLCETLCPMLKPMSMIKTLRANLAEEGILPKNIKEVFDLTNLYRNVWGKPKETRIKWAEGLNVNHVSQVENLDYLIFLDCASAYIERNQETARKFVEILNNVGISYGFLGPDEACDGNDILMMGEEGLFEDLANENIHKIKEYNIKKIITLSPHSYNALKNLYPQIDEDFNVDVVHYTQFLSNLIKSKRLKPKKILGKTATYHDPCYLGRHNAIYDEPRDILNNILLSPIKEMFYCKDKSICCGGGGGGLWIEKEDGIIMEQIRILHALELNVDVLVTACPFCTQQFETAKEDLNASIEIKDIIELVFESL